jgi:hypothetical protein
MRLDLSDEEAAALLSLLNRAIDDDRYPLSPRIRALRDIRAKFPARLRPSHLLRGRQHQESATGDGGRARDNDDAGEIGTGPPMTLGSTRRGPSTPDRVVPRLRPSSRARPDRTCWVIWRRDDRASISESGSCVLAAGAIRSTCWSAGRKSRKPSTNSPGLA